MNIVDIAIFIGLAAVSIVLVWGLVTMMRGQSPNLSQKLMRWRVILQFVTIIMVMTGFYLIGR